MHKKMLFQTSAVFLRSYISSCSVNDKVLQNKPKPYRISTLITAAFGGCLMVKTAVMTAFGQCKDPEYVMLIFLLNELVPLVFYFYTVIFRGGDQAKWLHSILQLMFIIQSHKATLCQLSALSIRRVWPFLIY